MTAEGNPNLFDYATSELSQDAFISWLLSWAGAPTDTPLRRVGLAFIRFLYCLDGPGREAGIEAPARITLTGRVKQQHLGIDVYFEARIDDREVCFVIEDKTDTSHHSDQLQRYLDAVQADRKMDETIGIYFKTGGWFKEDHEVVELGYRRLDAPAMHEFLSRYDDVRHPVLRDYVDHLERRYVVPQASFVPQVLDGDLAPLTQPWVAASVMALLRNAITEVHTSVAEAFPSFALGRIRRGTSRGQPWTQFTVARFHGMYGDKAETLFYRLDRRIGGYYISLRQYANIRDDEECRRHKVERLGRYRKLVSGLAYVGPLQMGRPVTDRSGNNESEIVVFFLRENPVVDLRKHLPGFHHSLMLAIAAAMADSR